MSEAAIARQVKRKVLPEDLGETRTIMAADRTLMAWIRTALSMFSFSFAIYKFIEGMNRDNGLLAGDNASRSVGLFLSGLGTLAIVMGTVEYWGTLRDIGRIERFRLGRPVLVIAALLSISGVMLFLGIVFKLI